MSWNERPPMLTGQATKDIAAIRDYLFRMSNGLTEAASQVDAIVTTDKDGNPALKPATTAETMKQQADDLKSLILKTANTVKKYADQIVTELSQETVAISDFGLYVEGARRQIEDYATGTIDKYEYSENTTGLLSDLVQFRTELNGEIRRGVIEDPATHEKTLGIAISQNLAYTGTKETGGDGNDYYTIDNTSMPTFGMYTSTGWQFWINGMKRAWLDAADGEMHIQQLTIEESLKMGGGWEIRHDTTSWGIRFIGG